MGLRDGLINQFSWLSRMHGVLYETGVFSNSKSKKELSILTRPLTKLSSTLAEILDTAKETIGYSFGKPDIRLKEAIYC